MLIPDVASRSVFLDQSLLLGEIPGDVTDLCIRERLGHRAHQRILAGALAVRLQRMHEVLVVLATEARRLRRERCVAVRAMARLAYLFCFFLAGFVVARL